MDQQQQNQQPQEMNEQQPKAPITPKPLWVRALLILIAIAVFLGSIFIVFLPGQKRNADTGAALLPTAAAEEEFKTLQKGGSGKQVREMQYALQELGYYEGKVDGNFNKVLEQAVLDFQKDFDLEQTGKIDYDLYLLLSADMPDVIPDSEKKTASSTKTPVKEEDEEADFVVRGEWYSDKEHVAAYLKKFDELPGNYLTKKEAQNLGWVSSKGNLWDVAPGMSIGGDRFGNYEGLLPRKNGRQYYECDIDFDGSFRNAKRIIFSNDGLIFYTDDHYENFEEIK